MEHCTLEKWRTEGRKRIFFSRLIPLGGSPGGSDGKESACNAGDSGSIPGSGRSAGGGIGYPLQYSWAFLVAQMVKNQIGRASCRERV